MQNQRQIFFNYLAQTSPSPVAIEVAKAEGCFLFDSEGKKYFDLISGISVSNLGHRNPEVIKAIHEQLEKYLHVMVYGEMIQSPQTLLAQMLTSILPDELNSVYFVNSGSEAVEGALKLAKRYTGRTELVTFKNGYHGSTHGALSAGGNEELKNSFRPLLPDVNILEFNDENELNFISEKTAAVIIEPVQGEAGVRIAAPIFLDALRKKCSATGALLIFDEIQTGCGRTGKMFAFEHYGIVPDILLLGKAFGGGMPLGAFVSSKKILDSFISNPVLGHITTFGGHPVCCVAAFASLKIIYEKKLFNDVEEKEKLFRQLLKHEKILAVRGKGLFLAVQFANADETHKIVNRCIASGVFVDWFLFAPDCIRIAPPLIITEKEISEACKIILKSI